MCLLDALKLVVVVVVYRGFETECTIVMLDEFELGKKKRNILYEREKKLERDHRKDHRGTSDSNLAAVGCEGVCITEFIGNRQETMVSVRPVMLDIVRARWLSKGMSWQA